MNLLVVGVNYRTAPVEIRERLAWSGERLNGALEKLSGYVTHGVILSTCNRTEVYTVAEKATSSRVANFLSDISGLPHFVVASYRYDFQQREVVRHLFRVASGVDSMIVGETQILGQVRQALDRAKVAGATTPSLVRLFQQSVKVGRLVRQATDISRNAASVSSASVDLVGRLMPDMAAAGVLVVGAGKIAQRVAKTLADRGVSRMTVINRTFQRAAELSATLGVAARPFEELGEALVSADVAITATGAAEYLIESPMVKEALKQRKQRPLYFIDIAVPRNIDPEVAKIKGVSLHDIDDLRSIAEANLQAREREVVKVEKIIEGEVSKFMAWWDAQEVLPILTALRSKAESIRRAELARALGKLPDLSEEQRSSLEAMSCAIVNKLLHQPTIVLKQGRDGTSYAWAIQELFGLDGKSGA
ncbi:MAG: glutamyl-tRNA reductase [Chloroflexota bacterium]|nr:glutamyl-tRNA reductase [Chloroflexota bacterium]